ncbi:MAG: short-chain dehydrogenase [Coxiella sp. (in: Bacteria)]|nr:MAG: short-chain dehydrogenase [Coxiella sp. (in: g-proteobacteria)]
MSIALVTGANRGIGLEFCRQLTPTHDVIAVCRQASSALTALGVEIIEGVDLTDHSALQGLANELGDRKVDLLVHNAGVWSSESIDHIDAATIMHGFQVNALAPLVLTSHLLNAGCINDPAKIALVTSRMGSIGDNTSGGRYGYRMSKAALNSAGRSMAIDLKDRHIAVALIHPGWVQTDMGGADATVTPEQTVSGMLTIINGLTIENSGRFWHQNGTELPW